MGRRVSNSRRSFLPGWEEGLFPHRSVRSTKTAARASRRSVSLAYVGITRAKRRAKIFFATNRRIHGLWQTTIPSRFLDELPADHVEVTEAPNGSQYGGYALSRFENMDTFSSSYNSPGWKRAQTRNTATGANAGGGAGRGGFSAGRAAGEAARRGPMTIEGDLVAKSSVASGFATGNRVFHQKFGPGAVAAVDGNKITVDFDKAGRKMVLESFLKAG